MVTNAFCLLNSPYDKAPSYKRCFSLLLCALKPQYISFQATAKCKIISQMEKLEQPFSQTRLKIFLLRSCPRKINVLKRHGNSFVFMLTSIDKNQLFGARLFKGCPEVFDKLHRLWTKTKRACMAIINLLHNKTKPSATSSLLVYY